MSDSPLLLHPLVLRSMVAPQITQSPALTAGFSSVTPVTLGAVPLFYLFGFLCLKFSSMCLISTLTPGGYSGHLFRLLFSVVLWRGGTLKINTTSTCGGGSDGWTTAAGFDTAQGSTYFPGLYCSGSRCSAKPRWAVHFVPFPGPSHSR